MCVRGPAMLEELCNIFKPYFDMLNTSTFRLISGVSGVVISGVYSLSSDDTVLEFKKIGGDADNRHILHYNSTTGLLLISGNKTFRMRLYKTVP